MFYVLCFSTGSARNTPEHSDMLRSRAVFKHGLKRCKIDREKHEADAIGSSFADGDSRQFWKNINNVKGDSFSCTPTHIDSVSGFSNIRDMWKKHFEELLNNNRCENGNLRIEELGSLDSNEINITPDVIKTAIKSLNTKTSNGKDDISTYHLKHAHQCIHIIISILFSSILVHNYIPGKMMDTVVTPIIKNKRGELSDKNNYRPIAVTNVIAKLFESVILQKCQDHLYSSDHQFGFKQKHSTDLCTFVLKEVVNNYNSNGSPVYLAFLDAEKAFDTVPHSVLFDKLLRRGVSPLYVRLLAYWYSKQQFFVKWAGDTSSSFTVSNGVRQGSILSPSLFNVFMDDLSSLLSNTFSGCYFNGQNFNHLFYADDTVLLAPSPHALQELINICQDYAVTCGIKYNVMKTKCMCLKPESRNLLVPNIYLYEKPVKWVKEHKYLGFFLRSDHCDLSDMNRQIQAIYGRGNMLLRKFKNCSRKVKAKLFTCYIESFYGIHLWSKYTSTLLDRVKVAYNNTFRFLFNVRRGSSVSAEMLGVNVKHFDIVFRNCIFNFVTRLFNTKNMLVIQIVNSLYFLNNSSTLKRWSENLYC